jgi:hypothetical protein
MLSWGHACDDRRPRPTRVSWMMLHCLLSLIEQMEDINLAGHILSPRSRNTNRRRNETLLQLLQQSTTICVLRPRLLAIQKTRPIPYRAKVLGRALVAARTDSNSFWMLLSGNAEVASPSATAAANLPTPATVAATGTPTANVADVAASVMSALTTTATASLPAAATAATSAATHSTASASDALAPTAAAASAANVATPSADQKRKASPLSYQLHPTRD